MSSRNEDEWVKESVIEHIRGGGNIARSGAWLAERSETGTIEVYKHAETIEE